MKLVLRILTFTKVTKLSLGNAPLVVRTLGVRKDSN